MIGERSELKGKRFGNLVALSPVGKNKRNSILWLCLCDCGNTVEVEASELNRGTRVSCGCRHYKDRQTIGGKPTRLYRIWKNMKKRCLNKNNTDYKYYGARGIKVCKEWNEFRPFMEWANSHGYKDTLTLDRIDNDGNYEPGNCKWATRKEHAQHRRPHGTVVRRTS